MTTTVRDAAAPGPRPSPPDYDVYDVTDLLYGTVAEYVAVTDAVVHFERKGGRTLLFSR